MARRLVANRRAASRARRARPRTRTARRTAGEAYVRAALCFHFAKYVWVLDGERNREPRRAPATPSTRRTGCSIRAPSGSRRRSRAGMVVANLRLPAGAERPPLVILIPGLDSTKEEFFNFERVFLDRGLATLSLDGPGQGEAGFEAPIRHDYEVAVGAALDALGRARRPRPRAGRRRRGQPRRLLRAARGRLRAAAEGGRGGLGATQLRRALGRPAELTRESFVHYSALARPRNRRGGPSELDLGAWRVGSPSRCW